MGYLLASPVRRLWQDPARIVAPYVREGMTVFEPGPGMGFFTLELARRVGASGHVVVVDVQPEMLDRLKRRLAKAGLLERVDVRLAPAHSMGMADLAETVDLVFAFAVVHEFPSSRTFFLEAAESLKPGGRMLLAEPAGHVSAAQFESELADAAKANLHPVDRPLIRRSRAALLQ
jgi:ubiquinone/menaquinone biosynthesis C-methylase UbiE